MKKIKILLSGIIFLNGCMLFGPSSPKSQTLYNKTISTGEHLKIIYSPTIENENFRLLISKKNKLIEHIDIKIFQKKILIDKLDLYPKGSNSVNRMVSDTSNNIFRSLDYIFQSTEYNNETHSTFSLLTTHDQIIFSLFINALSSKNLSNKFSQRDFDKMIGWVKVYY